MGWYRSSSFFGDGITPKRTPDVSPASANSPSTSGTTNTDCLELLSLGFYNAFAIAFAHRNDLFFDDASCIMGAALASFDINRWE